MSRDWGKERVQLKTGRVHKGRVLREDQLWPNERVLNRKHWTPVVSSQLLSCARCYRRHEVYETGFDLN